MPPFPRHLYLLPLCACLTACNDDDTTYTLYRTGTDLTAPDIASIRVDEALRIHVASFNADKGDDTASRSENAKNCEIAAQLFNHRQPFYDSETFSHIRLRYWCEKGKYKK